ncbi:hypothetical protein NQ314_019037 [Rhamnusium bicolor]|uniref:DUF8040 domain-containing protein n=1 Tax=Rhamnusium bicolor TaxID=1586634 RepID=A0AAV8WQ82_9CUCU|nr:hypothetical protein NQ314_019037 [Rhamnusium bicolor]
MEMYITRSIELSDVSSTESDASTEEQGYFLLEEKHCIKDYFEKTVPTYSEKEFKTHFRINKTLFEDLSNKFCKSNIFRKRRNYNLVSPSKHLAVFLWFASHEACSYRDIDRFNLSLWTVHHIIYHVTMLLSNMPKDIIKWPNKNQIVETAEHYSRKKASLT